MALCLCPLLYRILELGHPQMSQLQKLSGAVQGWYVSHLDIGILTKISAFFQFSKVSSFTSITVYFTCISCKNLVSVRLVFGFPELSSSTKKNDTSFPLFFRSTCYTLYYKHTTHAVYVCQKNAWPCGLRTNAEFASEKLKLDPEKVAISVPDE